MRKNKFLDIDNKHLKSHLIRLSGFFLSCFLCFFNSTLSAENDATLPVPGDAIVVASIGDAKSLIPILASDTSSAEICGLIFSGLVKYDKDINLVGDLAKSWEIRENGLKIIFHLRQGVKWHDGVAFTAEDVKFTFDKLRDPQVKTPYSGDFLKVRSLIVIDPYAVEITYDEPFSPGLASWAMGIMPKHILKNQDLNTCDFSNNPIGTGPYRFKKWLRQNRIELVANQDYFENKPYIARYIYRVIPDQATQFLELETQTVDLCGLSAPQYLRQTNNDFFEKNYNKYKTPSFGYTYLGYNLEDQKFKDKRVRQAINYAVNKNEIINIVLLGMGEITTGPFLPQSWAFDGSVKDVGYDPKKALEILNEAGWQDKNKDGILEKDGKSFEFTIITNQGNEQRIKTAELIQKYLKNIGIKVKIKVLEWSSLLSEFIDKGRFEAVLFGWSLARDPDCYDIWHSSKIREGEFNFIHYRNLEVDDLLDKARKMFDMAERKQCYNKIHQLIYADQPCLFLYTADSLEILSSRFKGIKPAPIGIGYNFTKWWVPKNQQRYRTEIER